MATYYDIFGQKVQYLSSDPSNVVEGQVWYNSTGKVGKVQGFQSAAWSSGGAMSGGSGDGGMAKAGSQTAFLASMGSPGARNDTEEYDGSSWSNAPTTPYSASGVISFGTQTAGLVAGGQPGGGGVSTTAKYDGSSWTTSGSTPYPILYQFGGAGPQTAGISIGGWNQGHPTGGDKTDVKTFNGSTWSTEPATCPFPAYSGNHYGTNSEDCNYFGGYNPAAPTFSRNTTHVNYNGTAFTSLAAYPITIASCGTSGTTSEGYAWGGNYRPSGSPDYTDIGNDWNGSAWTTGTSYPATTQTMFSGGSTVPVSISSGGYTGSYVTSTFEFTAAGATTQTIATT